MIDKDKVLEAVATSIKDKIGKGIGVRVSDDFYTELADLTLKAMAKACPEFRPNRVIDALANYKQILQWGKDVAV